VSIQLYPGEQKIGAGSAVFTFPGAKKFNGQFTITDSRILYEMFVNADVQGQIPDIMFLRLGSVGYIELERELISDVKTKTNIMGKRIMIRMKDGSAYNFEMGWWKNRKLIDTLKNNYLHIGSKIARSVFFSLSFLIAAVFTISAQSVGIGTTTPNSNAILDIRSTTKGVIFPSMTSAQRDAMVNPPDGLHIYNRDDKCLNFYDSAFATWSCYCDGDICKTIFIHITADVSGLDFNSIYASKYPAARKFAVLVDANVTVTLLVFATLPTSSQYTIKIINHGNMLGGGGTGGAGVSGQSGGCAIAATGGNPGGYAILSNINVHLQIDNYGIIAGGGGGGGGGGRSAAGQYGGGGGGGAGFLGSGTGGQGGGTTSNSFGCMLFSQVAQSGVSGTLVSGGTGGTGASGGGNGGNAGGRGQAGQNGTGTGAGTGGAAGPAILGGSNNVIINLGTGQVFGTY
jgi:hypothetical protein